MEYLYLVIVYFGGNAYFASPDGNSNNNNSQL